MSHRCGYPRLRKKEREANGRRRKRVENGEWRKEKREKRKGKGARIVAMLIKFAAQYASGKLIE